MGLFKKKLSDEDLIKQNIESQQAETEAKENANKKSDNEFGDSQLGVEVTKIKAQLEGIGEQRKATSERFQRLTEELGEIRQMVMETNKGVSKIEAASTRAIDLVESVKPEELMLEVRKQDTKIEALKANIESNESLMRDLMKEIKEMRRKMDFYKGVEQISKMNEEIKTELIDIKKTESVIERHSNKVESIYIDVEKKFTEFDKYGDTTKDLKRSFDKIQADVDKLRVKTEDKADKPELVKFINKFNDFEKHTSNIINLLDDRSKSAIDYINMRFEKVNRDLNDRVDQAIKRLNLPPEQLAQLAQSPESEQTGTEQKPDEKKGFSIGGFFKKKEEAQPKPQ